MARVPGLPARIALTLDSLAYRLALRWAINDVIDGLWIGALDWSDRYTVERDTRLLDRVREAVKCLSCHDPTGFARVRRLLKRVLVFPAPGSRGV
jgi:hypothetical protein